MQHSTGIQSVIPQSSRSILWALKVLLEKLLVSILLVTISFPVAISAGLSQPAQTVTSTITQTVTSSVLVTVFQTTKAYSGSYLIPAVSKDRPIAVPTDLMCLTASAGPITGTVTSNSTELNFKIASLSDFNIWAPNGVGRNCLGPENAIVAYEAVTSNTFSANLPSDGGYVMTFINRPADKAAYVNISTNYPAAHPSTVTMTSYVLQTQLQTQTSVANPLTSIPGFPLESLLLGLLLALAILMVERSRKVRLA